MFEDPLAGNMKITVFWVVLLEVRLNVNILENLQGRNLLYLDKGEGKCFLQNLVTMLSG
jgi:hypothetical protein